MAERRVGVTYRIRLFSGLDRYLVFSLASPCSIASSFSLPSSHLSSPLYSPLILLLFFALLSDSSSLCLIDRKKAWTTHDVPFLGPPAAHPRTFPAFPAITHSTLDALLTFLSSDPLLIAYQYSLGKSDSSLVRCRFSLQILLPLRSILLPDSLQSVRMAKEALKTSEV